MFLLILRRDDRWPGLPQASRKGFIAGPAGLCRDPLSMAGPRPHTHLPPVPTFRASATPTPHPCPRRHCVEAGLWWAPCSPHPSHTYGNVLTFIVNHIWGKRIAGQGVGGCATPPHHHSTLHDAVQPPPRWVTSEDNERTYMKLFLVMSGRPCLSSVGAGVWKAMLTC